MFLLGAWVLGKQFALTTVLSTIIYPVLLGVMEGSGFGGFVLEEKLVAVLYAGLLIGGGIGIVMRAGASTGAWTFLPWCLRKAGCECVHDSVYHGLCGSGASAD